MKCLRLLLAGAVLLGITAVSNADYVLIRCVVGGKQKTDPNNPLSGDPRNPGAPAPPPGGPIRPPGAPAPPPGSPGPGDDGSGGLPTLAGGQVVDVDTAAFVVQGIAQVTFKAPYPGRVTTKYTAGPKAYTTLFNDNQSLFSLALPKFPSRIALWNNKRQAVFKNRTSDRILEAADWALAHGLLPEFEAFMDEMVKNKDADGAQANKSLKDAVEAYVATKAALAKSSSGEKATIFWKDRLGFKLEQSEHYSLLYSSPVTGPPEVTSRLKLLEQHMKGFYYWFALKGVALPVPSEKLVCVLVDQPNEFIRQRAIVEDEPLVTDGFYANRDNICVFSTQRVDPAYRVYSRQVQTVYAQGYERAGLVDGTARRRGATLTPSDFARFQTMALLDRLLEEEAERAAVSHEGSRQLMVATGLVPRTVVPPQWAQFGSASFFETSKGPFIGAPVAAAVAFWPGWGAPSWAYVRPFKQFEQTTREPGREIPPADVLRQVVTDTYFHQILSFADRPKIIRARATAWSLGYYLMRARLPGMIRYFQELSQLPRDLEMDNKTLLAAFARAFDVANETRDGIDPQKFEELAKSWLAYMRGVAAPGAEFGLDPQAVGGDPNAPQGGGTPGTPGSPGGGPGSDGGPSRPPGGGGGRGPGG